VLDKTKKLKGTRLISNLSERQIVKIWQHQLLDRTELATEEGEGIKIIYPGRMNDDQGADFRDAVIATSRGLTKGDIEIHVKSSDWQAHRHHHDQVYNRVILHVVMWHNTKAATNLQNGRGVPILALYKYIKETISQWPNGVEPLPALNIPCRKVAECLATGIMAELLDDAGEERFLAKAARFQGDLAQMEASQSLYQGIMGALGYSKNKLPFLELARRLPIWILESITRGKISDAECLAQQQALLLGTAGLLPSQRQSRYQENKLDDKWIDKLERLWASSLHTETMSSNAWHLFKVRPNNSPIRRLVAMSYLTLRYKRKGIFEELVNIAQEVPVSKGYYRLEKGLTVTTNGYWASHFDFGLGSRIRNQTLLGSRRAADITVNVLLPFTFAWGQLTSQPELAKKALNLYCNYPKLAVNSVERHMREQLGLSSRLVNSARRQQGLVHIYNTSCTQGRCDSCPLSKPHLLFTGRRSRWQYTGFQPAS